MNAVILGLTLLVLLIGPTYGQRNNRRKGKPGGRKDQCHLKEMEECINKMQELGKGPDPTKIIASNDGLNKICKYVIHFNSYHYQ